MAFILWRCDSTLAVVLLVWLGLGAFIAALVSTPSVLRGQWGGTRLRPPVFSPAGVRCRQACKRQGITP